jgi:hypothetical protein
MVIKGKTEELLVKKHNTSENNMQDTHWLHQKIKPEDHEEKEEVQAQEMSNIINKIITENFPNLEKTMPIQIQETSRTHLTHDILSLKQQAQKLETEYWRL